MGKTKKPRIKDKPIHPYSRKAAQMSRSVTREHRLDQRKSDANQRLHAQGEMLLWFRDHLPLDKDVLSNDDVAEVVGMYLHRFDSELEQIEIINSIKGRKRKQHASREDCIKHTIERIKMELESGSLEMPDFFSEANVSYLRDWRGELRYIPNIKMRLYSLGDIEQQSTDLQRTYTVNPETGEVTCTESSLAEDKLYECNDNRLMEVDCHES